MNVILCASPNSVDHPRDHRLWVRCVRIESPRDLEAFHRLYQSTRSTIVHLLHERHSEPIPDLSRSSPRPLGRDLEAFHRLYRLRSTPLQATTSAYTSHSSRDLIPTTIATLPITKMRS